MHKDMIFNELYLSYASHMHKDMILDEFIHIICIENKETILIGVTSGFDTTVGFLLARHYDHPNYVDVNSPT